jgi:hypothetical protein
MINPNMRNKEIRIRRNKKGKEFLLPGILMQEYITHLI